MIKKPTVLDLFSGAGGISHGFEQAGFRVVAGVDIDKDAVTTFQTNHKDAKGVEADLSTLPPGELMAQLNIGKGAIDCIVGGPPCQGFSKNRAFRHKDGTFADDFRNYLFWHYFDFVEHIRPKVVLMENVPEILIKKNGWFRDAILEKFGELGYTAVAQILVANEYGVPQRRRRAFFLAGIDGLELSLPSQTTLAGKRAGKRTPKSDNFISQNQLLQPEAGLSISLQQSPSVWDAISDLHGCYADSLDKPGNYARPPQTKFQEEMRSSAKEVYNHFPWPLSERQLRRIELLQEGQGQEHLPLELQTKQGYGSAYRRLDSKSQALTITTWMFHPGSGMFTHPFENRVITIREAARLQSFRDSFRFTGKYHSQCRQVGNSVAPLVAKKIAEKIIGALDVSSTDSDLVAAS